MTQPLSICLPCGLCCDSTMIGFVQLHNEELPLLRDLLEITETNGEGFFLDPCKKHINGKCTIYSQRPKECIKFNCKLVKSIEDKKVEFDTAVDVINLVKEKRISIEKKMDCSGFELQYPSFYFKVLELKKLMRKKVSDSAFILRYQKLMIEIDVLSEILLKYFGVSLS